ncbi:entericidin A/B family lipoprotein [Erythrobacter sp. F6033]|nr:entericidin A/B family lipoprotein [Erythrobacter sp. F6033]MCK0128890.1 entericidin A/B family lipoprotein [Erythrobacter sp. F6033]
MTRKTLLAVTLAALTMTATACNTVKGLGEDIKSVGEAGEKAID